MNKIKEICLKIPVSIVSATKEGIRLVIIAVLDFLLVAGVLNTIVVAITGNSIPPEIITGIISALLVILKSIDKYLHEQGKIEGDPNKTLGIARI